MNAKDTMIETWRKEDEYRQWLDFLDQQQEWFASLVKHGYLPSHKETHHAEVQH